MIIITIISIIIPLIGNQRNFSVCKSSHIFFAFLFFPFFFLHFSVIIFITKIMGAAQSKRKNCSKDSIQAEHSSINHKYRHHSAEPPSLTRQRSQSSTSRPAYSSLSERAASYSSGRPQLPFLPENSASNNSSNDSSDNSGSNSDSTSSNNSIRCNNLPLANTSLQSQQQPPLGGQQRRRTLTGPIKRPDEYALQTDSVYLPHDWDVEDRFFSVSNSGLKKTREKIKLLYYR